MLGEIVSIIYTKSGTACTRAVQLFVEISISGGPLTFHQSEFIMVETSFRNYAFRPGFSVGGDFQDRIMRWKELWSEILVNRVTS